MFTALNRACREADIVEVEHGGCLHEVDGEHLARLTGKFEEHVGGSRHGEYEKTQKALISILFQLISDSIEFS